MYLELETKKKERTDEPKRSKRTLFQIKQRSKLDLQTGPAHYSHA